MMLGAADLIQGDAGSLRFAAGGAVRIEAEVERTSDSAGRLNVHLRVRDGWHVNSLQPLSENLIPTQLDIGDKRGGARLGPVEGPPPKQVLLGFQEQPLSLYEGHVTLSAPIEWESDEARVPILPVRVRLQACDESSCQLPETIELQVAAAPPRH